MWVSKTGTNHGLSGWVVTYMEDQKYSKGSVNAGTPFPKPLDNIVVKKVADVAVKCRTLLICRKRNLHGGMI